LIADFRAIPPAFLDRDCDVISTVSYGESQSHEVGSTLAREIVYSVGHAIHHYAIIKLLCAGFGLELPYEFGIAPSTLKHAAMARQG
jgi:hypothetical protein